MAAKGNPEAVIGLDKLITEARARLSTNPDFIALRAMEKARAEIIGVKGASPTPAVMLSLNLDYQDTPHPLEGEPGAKKVSQLAAAEVALDKVGHPLSAEDLMGAAQAEGAVIGGTKPVISFGSSLSKSPKFKSVRWRGHYAWWFSDRPVPSSVTRLRPREAAE
jgi:hypothetical protein